MAFSLTSTVQIGAAVLRVQFSGEMPLSASKFGPHDCRNPANWRLFGPSIVEVEEIRTVPSDPFSFDLICSAVVAAGNWVAIADNVQTVHGAALETDRVIFEAVGPQPFFSVPSDQITSETALRQSLNAALDGPGWQAFVAALGYSDEKVAAIGRNAFYQRLLATAGGEYLERLTTSYGVDRPPNVRMSDDTLRTLTIGLNNNKVNATGLEAVLLAYYGLDATVAHAQSGMPELFSLEDGDDLHFVIDDMDVTVVFRDDDFAAISLARATEVAAVINRQLWLKGLRAFATASTDPETGLVYLRIYSGLNGIRGRMRFLGGDAMRALRFPEIVGTTQAAGTQWSLDPSTVSNGVPVGNVRLTWTGGADPVLSSIFPGDFLNIYGSPFLAENRGVFEVVATTPTSIDFAASGFETQQSATQVAVEDLFFVRSHIVSLNGQYVAAVVGPDLDSAEILLPVTAVAVEREASTGWYLNGCQSLTIDGDYALSGRLDGNTTVRIKTTAPHGLTAGRFFFLDEVEIDYTEDLGDPFEIFEGISLTIQGAVLLSDGRVMLVNNDGDYYFFNTETNTTASGGYYPLNPELGLCLLSDGRVLGADGANWSIYDPETNVWTSAAALPETSSYAPNFSMTLLRNGKVLLSYTDNATSEVHSSVFDPETASWSTPILVDATAYSYFAQVRIETTGDVVWACGDGTKAHYYRWLNDEWEDLDDMPIQLGYTRGIFVPRGPTGEAWFVGDQVTDPQQILVFNAETLTWSTRDLLQSPDQGSARTLVQRNGQVYFIPVHQNFSWELHAPGESTARILTETTGPASSDSSTNFPWAFNLEDGRILALAGQNGHFTAYYHYADQRRRSGGHLAGYFKVTGAPAPDIIEFATPESTAHTRIASARVTTVLAELGTIQSGIMLNPQDGVAMADAQTALTADVSKGFVPQVINVGSTDGFTDEPGYLVIAFGTSRQSAPVHYLGIASATSIRLDPNEKLTHSYDSGDTVTLLLGRGVYSPAISQPLGVTWLTDSSIGRIEAEKDLDLTVGVGENVVNHVLYPGDRGLGNEGRPRSGTTKISDVIAIWGSDSYLLEAEQAREDE